MSYDKNDKISGHDFVQLTYLRNSIYALFNIQDEDFWQPKQERFADSWKFFFTFSKLDKIITCAPKSINTYSYSENENMRDVFCHKFT